MGAFMSLTEPNSAAAILQFAIAFGYFVFVYRMFRGKVRLQGSRRVR
jgi:cytochrome bd-type quinol oxidase subunit 2